MKCMPTKPKKSSFLRRWNQVKLYAGTMMDDSPHPRLALRAMTGSAVESRFANVRSGIPFSQSRLRGNDGALGIRGDSNNE